MPKKAAPTVFRGDASYLLVGGFGGIGRALALKLVEAGAKHILFLSRSGAASTGAASTLELLRERRAVVSVFQCDVADTTAVSQALGQVSLRGHPPIRGVFHLGLVIRNALFEKITLADWDGSLAPKVRGTWNLHRLLPRDLDFFVLVSSMVGVFGNPSQAAYAAASTFQDAFANYRLARSLPAVTVDLGMVTGVGYVAERGRVETRLRAQGFEEIPEAECLALLEAAVACPFRAPAVGNIMTGMGLGRFSGGDVHGAAFRDPRFSHARRLALMADARREGTEGARNATSVRVREAFARASSFSEAQNVVLLAVKEKLAGLLMINADDINAAATMSDYGLDSLIAVVSSYQSASPTELTGNKQEMRNWILGEMETNVAILELLGSQTILELCATIARQSKLLRKDLPQV